MIVNLTELSLRSHDKLRPKCFSFHSTRVALRSILTTSFVCILLASFPTNASAKPSPPLDSMIDIAPITEAYPESGVLLGQGWNSVASQKAPGVCVVGVEKPILGNGATMNYSYLLDKEQLLDSMSISASASFKGWIGGGSLSSSFSQALKINTNKTNILATVVADKGGVQYAPAAVEGRIFSQKIYFTPEAQKLLDNDIDAFTKLCGDGYVASRRDGGRLDLVFELSAAQKDKMAAATMDASGHIGPTSGSISFKKSHQEIMSKEDTSVQQLQQGGHLTMISSAEEALKKITDFATFDPAQSHPYRITIYSYRMLPGFPNSKKTTSFLKLRSYLSQSLRLADISNTYSDAAMNPLNYYFPFQTNTGEAGRKELMSVARVASAASICLDKFVTWCSATGNCNLDDALKTPMFKDRCEALSDNLNDEEKLLAKSLLIGLAQEDVNSVKVAIKNLSAKNNLAAYIRPTDDRSPYWLYMRLLSNAPLIRLRDASNIGKSLPGDQLDEVRIICTNPKTPCAYLEPGQLTSTSQVETLKAQSEAFQKWVLNRRLYPLSRTFCEISRSHPMCFETDELFYLSSEIKLQTGGNRNFEVEPPAPPPPIPPTTPPTEPSRRTRGSCEGMMPHHECH